jgi:phosphoglycerate dehydrogenase-like enzyme
VADHAIALMLALARGLLSYHARLLADPHAGWRWSGAPLVRRLRGGTFGIVGMGRIGTATSRRARALDMDVCFYDPYLPDGRQATATGATTASSPACRIRRGQLLPAHPDNAT